MKLMSIDYGRRRIGLAVKNDTGIPIRGLPTIDRKKKPDYLAVLTTIISLEQPDRIIVGLPLDVEDAETVMSREVRSFAAKLEARVSLPICFVDESNSSQQAAKLLLHRKKRERADKGAVDRMAACLILEHYTRECECSGMVDGS